MVDQDDQLMTAGTSWRGWFTKSRRSDDQAFILQNIKTPAVFGVAVFVLALVIRFVVDQSAVTPTGVIFDVTSGVLAFLASLGILLLFAYRGRYIDDFAEKSGSIGRKIDAVFSEINRIESITSQLHKHISRLENETERLVKKTKLLDAVTRIHQDVDPKYYAEIALLVERSGRDGGGVIIDSTTDDYMEAISNILLLEPSEYFATQRGGRTPSYCLQYFMTNDEESASYQKLEYFERVNEAAIDRDLKTRILFFDRFEEPFVRDFANVVWRQKYFECSDKVQLFLADPSMVEYRFTEQCNMAPGRATFLWEDFVIFDNDIVVRINGRSSLCIATSQQIKRYVSLKEFCRNYITRLKEKGIVEDSMIAPLTSAGIGNHTWSEWEKHPKVRAILDGNT